MSYLDVLKLSSHAAHLSVPGLGAAIDLGINIYGAIEKVKVCRRQCRYLGDRCAKLLLVLRDSSEGMEGTRAIELTDEVEGTVRRIWSRVREWGELGLLQSVIQQSRVIEGIDRFHREIDACMEKFDVYAKMELFRGTRHLQLMSEQHAADAAEFRITLQRLVTQSDTLLGIRSPEALDSIMTTLRTELLNPDIETTQEESFRMALSELDRESSRLPPLDLKGPFEITSNGPIAYGTYNDVFKGQWLKQPTSETVALRCPRMLGNPAVIRKRLKNEVIIWRKLHHPNITPLYGIASIGDSVYTVSQWMDHGNVVTYVQQNVNVNRLRLLSQVASGMNYLHSNKIVHGDLRGTNVLISKDGVAHLSHFEFSRPLDGRPPTADMDISIQSDTWNFALLALELLTGDHSRPRNSTLPIRQRRPPERPGALATSRGLSDELWELMNQCWSMAPGSQPPMSSVKVTIERLQQGLPSSGDQQAVSPIPHSPGPSTRVVRRPSLSLRRSESTDSGNSEGSRGGRWSRLFRTSSSQGRDMDPHPSPILTTSATSMRGSPPPQLSLSVVQEHEDPFRSEYMGTLAEQIISDSNSDRPPSSHRSSGGISPTSLELEQLQAPSQDLPPTLLSSDIVSDPTLFVREAGDHSVKAGTVEGLIERLIDHCSIPPEGHIPVTGMRVEDPRMTEDYREIFFLTYTGFTTTETVFRFLHSRFQKAEDFAPERRAKVLFNIIRAIGRWVINPHVRIEREVLTQIKTFLLNIQVAPFMKERAKEVAATIVFPDVSPLPPRRGRVPVPKPSDISPGSLAKALTMMEGELYNRLRPADYIQHLLPSSTNNNITAASTTNDQIVYWVQKSILFSKEKERATLFTFFAYTAIECRNLHNFASLAAIVTALQSPVIKCLLLTRERVKDNRNSPHLLERLSDLENLLTSGPYHQLYKAALEESKDPCVPWIGAHLPDLSVVLNKYPATIDDTGQTLVNFVRYIKFHSQMKKLLQYKAPSWEHDRSAKSSLAYLESQLQPIRVDARTKHDLEKRSRAVEEEEKKSRARRDREFEVLGFQ